MKLNGVEDNNLVLETNTLTQKLCDDSRDRVTHQSAEMPSEMKSDILPSGF